MIDTPLTQSLLMLIKLSNLVLLRFLFLIQYFIKIAKHPHHVLPS